MKQLSFDVVGPDRSRKGIDWDEQPLGLEPDVIIAKRVNVSRSVVLNQRRKRGIPVCRVWTGDPGARRWVDWDSQPLGKMSDKRLARNLGVHFTTVANAREGRGIAAFGSRRCECGAERPRGQSTCTPCQSLDGGHFSPVSRALVSELRILGRSTWDAIRLSLADYTERTLYRGMGELIAAGRVRRITSENGAFNVPGQIDEEAEFELCQPPR